MQYINLPQKIHKTINQIKRNFIWGSTSEKKKLHLFSWEKISTTKKIRGLGLQKGELRNKAAHAILSWRMYHNTQSPWAKILYHKYCRQYQLEPKKKDMFKNLEVYQGGLEYLPPKPEMDSI